MYPCWTNKHGFNRWVYPHPAVNAQLNFEIPTEHLVEVWMLPKCHKITKFFKTPTAFFTRKKNGKKFTKCLVMSLSERKSTHESKQICIFRRSKVSAAGYMKVRRNFQQNHLHLANSNKNWIISPHSLPPAVLWRSTDRNKTLNSSPTTEFPMRQN